MNQVDLGPEAVWSLGVVSALAGLAMVYVFRRWSDQHALRATTNRMLAHLMEFRLFVDEPALVMRAQRDLFIANWRLLRLLARPSLILVVPSIILLAQMDACYGRAPLRIGDAAVVTVQFKNTVRAAKFEIVLKTPTAIRVETPGVRIVSMNQMSWRIRPNASSSGELQVIGPEHAITKSIAAGKGVHYLSEQRVSSVLTFLLHLNEPPLVDSSIALIEVLYPSATILHLHWLVWFLLISSGTAIVVSGLPRIIQRMGEAI
ncbi:MAG: hypothetical protein ACR2JB_04590 [Bryobacteraceae bacterium]